VLIATARVLKDVLHVVHKMVQPITIIKHVPPHPAVGRQTCKVYQISKVHAILAYRTGALEAKSCTFALPEQGHLGRIATVVTEKMGGAPARKHPLALHVHDLVNVAALPVLGGLCIAALLGFFDAAMVHLYSCPDDAWLKVSSFPPGE
jgi:hypothetical protein